MSDPVIHRYREHNGRPVFDPDLFEWSLWWEAYQEAGQHVVACAKIGDWILRTKFIGFDLAALNRWGPPVLAYETIAQRGGDCRQWLWETRLRALAGHDQVTATIRDEGGRR